MKVSYTKDRKDLERRARTWFSKFDRFTTDRVLAKSTEWMNQIAEASVQGTAKDIEIWSTAIQPDREFWGVASRHQNAANTLMSVLAGIISKLRSGGDLTEKQLDNLKKIAEVMTTLNGEPNWTWEDRDDLTDQTQDLRERLFD